MEPTTTYTNVRIVDAHDDHVTAHVDTASSTYLVELDGGRLRINNAPCSFDTFDVVLALLQPAIDAFTAAG